MSEAIGKMSKEKQVQATLERGVQQEKSERKAKRLAQHQHWMRVMMEGQSTPDLSYQNPKP